MAIKHKRKNSTGYTWQSGDLVEGQIGLNIADGTAHIKKANGDVVTIGGGAGSVALNDLTDVVITAASSGEILQYNGTNWVDVNPSTLDVASAALALQVDVVADSTNAVRYPMFSNVTTGATAGRIDDGLTYNPSTNTLTTTNFVGGLSGNASTASSATYASAVTLTADNTTNATNYPLFVNAATGNLSPRTDTGFTYNPSTGVITATSFSGAHNGTVGATTANTGAFTTLSATTSASLKAVNEGAVYDLGTTSGTVAPNVANGNVQKITLNGNLTINAFTSPVAGQTLTLIINGGATYTAITSTMKFAGGLKALTGTAACVDVLTVYYDGTNYWASIGKDFK